MVTLPRGQEIQGLHVIRSLLQGAILRLVWLKGRKTHSVRNSIGMRNAPRPNGHAGFARIDSVCRGHAGQADRTPASVSGSNCAVPPQSFGDIGGHKLVQADALGFGP